MTIFFMVFCGAILLVIVLFLWGLQKHLVQIHKDIKNTNEISSDIGKNILSTLKEMSENRDALYEWKMSELIEEVKKQNVGKAIKDE